MVGGWVGWRDIMERYNGLSFCDLEYADATRAPRVVLHITSEIVQCCHLTQSFLQCGYRYHGTNMILFESKHCCHSHHAIYIWVPNLNTYKKNKRQAAWEYRNSDNQQASSQATQSSTQTNESKQVQASTRANSDNQQTSSQATQNGRSPHVHVQANTTNSHIYIYVYIYIYMCLPHHVAEECT